MEEFINGLIEDVLKEKNITLWKIEDLGCFNTCSHYPLMIKLIEAFKVSETYKHVSACFSSVFTRSSKFL